MKQCKALLRKEWNTHKAGFLMPLWFTGGVYVTALLGWIISLIKGSGIVYQIQTGEIPFGMENLLLYTGSAGAAALLGFVSLVTAISLSDSLINGGFKRRCEILHLSQPVAFSKIAITKYLFICAGTILLYGALSLVNSLVISLGTGYLIHTQTYYGLVGWLQIWILMSLSILFMASLFWFFAGLFKRKSFFMGILTIMAIQAVISILNYTAGWHIPSLASYLAELVAVNVSFDPESANLGIQNINLVIQQAWQNIFSWNSLLKVIYSAVLFIGGAWLYKRRELT